MISTLLSLTSTKDMGPLSPILEVPREYFDTHLARSRNSSISGARSSLVDISSTARRSPPITDTSVNDLPSLLSHSHRTVHIGRVAVGRHDIDAWTQERKVHDIEFNAVEASFSLDSGGIAGDHFPVDAAKSSFAPMELQSESRFVQRLPADTAVLPYDWTSLVAPGFGFSTVQPDASIGYLSHDCLSEGRRNVGQILVRCGVINVSGMPPITSTVVGRRHDSVARPANTPATTSSVIAELHSSENEGLLTTALANWTSDWIRTLVIQPYFQGNFRFQYKGLPSRASTAVALRIRRILNAVENPVQVTIHALWLIGTLTGNGAHDNVPFLSVPIFRYLHNNGAFVAEDFMFHAFVICAMIGDKTVNDATLSTSTWSRLTGIPQVTLNATEKYALSCLKWNVLMTRTQWHDTIIYLRSCIKMGSAFDPFAYDALSPSSIMARYLNELIDISYGDKIYTSQQGPTPEPLDQDLTHWTAEWCPKHDPVINLKPRTICIAPGADQKVQKSSTAEVGTTAKDLLDSILGSSNIPDLAHVAQPAGTSFCGSFGIIGARLAHTIRIASHGACQSASWIPSHG